MKILYLECNMGAAGDMLTAALFELLSDRELFLRTINNAGIPGVQITAEPVVKCGVAGTHIAVTVHGKEEQSCDVSGRCGAEDELHHHETYPHHHSSKSEIDAIIEQLQVSESVKLNIHAVYNLITDAESAVHKLPAAEIHFHEVGMMDALADITGVCLLMEMLSPDRVVVSPVHVGSGQVQCAHGILPVPAPATAWILRGIPTYSGTVSGELCTPTGAALLNYFADDFGPLPQLSVQSIGYGMGKKDFDRANCVRAFWGTGETVCNDVCELSCNLDDMTAEAVGYAQEVLFKNGALDVFTTPIGMKKSRPGILFTCICKNDEAEKLARLMLLHTSTIGVRRYECCRYTLERAEKTVQTAAGPVRMKTSKGYGVEKEKAEYEDVARIAREKNISFSDALKIVDSVNNATQT